MTAKLYPSELIETDFIRPVQFGLASDFIGFFNGFPAPKTSHTLRLGLSVPANKNLKKKRIDLPIKNLDFYLPVFEKAIEYTLS